MAENTNLEPLWVILPGAGYALRFAPQAYAVDFLAFTASRSQWGDDPQWTWDLCDGGFDAFRFEQWEQADWDISGGLKWDGCINWETNPECMVHGCGPGHADAIASVFATVYHIGKRYFDLLGDEVPALPADAIEQAGDVTVACAEPA